MLGLPIVTPLKEETTLHNFLDNESTRALTPITYQDDQYFEPNLFKRNKIRNLFQNVDIDLTLVNQGDRLSSPRVDNNVS